MEHGIFVSIRLFEIVPFYSEMFLLTNVDKIIIIKILYKEMI